MSTNVNVGAIEASIGLNTARLRQGQQEVSQILGGIKSQLASMGAAAGVSLGGAGIVSAVAAIARAGAGLEHQMNKVGGVLQADLATTKALTAAATEMGRKTEFTAGQAGQAMENLAKAGFTAKQTMEALPGVLSMATAASMDLGQAAEIAVGALRAFELPVAELGRVNDVLVGVANRTATSVQGLGETLTYAAPVANALGYSLEDLMAMTGALGNKMVQGSMAGTQLGMAMQAAAENAGKFGAKSTKLLDVLEAMNKAWADLDPETRALKFTEAFGERGGRAALILASSVAQARALRAELDGVAGESETLAERMRSGTKGAMDVLNSTVEMLRTTVFDVFKNDLVDGINAVNAGLLEQERRLKLVGQAASHAARAQIEMLASLIKPFSGDFGASGALANFLSEKATTEDWLRTAGGIFKAGLTTTNQSGTAAESAAREQALRDKSDSEWAAFRTRWLERMVEMAIAAGAPERAMKLALDAMKNYERGLTVSGADPLGELLQRNAGFALGPRAPFEFHGRDVGGVAAGGGGGRGGGLTEEDLKKRASAEEEMANYVKIRELAIDKVIDIQTAGMAYIERLNREHLERVIDYNGAADETYLARQFEIDQKRIASAQAASDTMLDIERQRTAAQLEMANNLADTAFGVMDAAAQKYYAHEEGRQKNMAKIGVSIAQETLAEWLRAKAKMYIVEAGHNLLMAGRMALIGAWGAAAGLAAQAAAWTGAAAGLVAGAGALTANAQRNMQGPTWNDQTSTAAGSDRRDTNGYRGVNVDVSQQSAVPNVYQFSISIQGGIQMFGTGHDNTARELLRVLRPELENWIESRAA